MSSSYQAADVAATAIEMFNALSALHNQTVDVLGKRGVSPEQAALSSYIAFRVLLVSMETAINGILAPESWASVEAVIKLMAQHNGDAPEASAKATA